MFRSPATLAYYGNTSYLPHSRARPLAFQHVQKRPALLLLGCVALAIGLYFALPWLFPVPQSNHLIGRWQLQTQIRNGSRVPSSGEYEFRSDYTTRKITGISSTRAGLWIIRVPIDSTVHSSSVVLPNTTIITTTYRFIDPLMHHISVQIYDQQGTPDANLWPGPGIYDITMINNNQLMLRIPDAEAGGWIVLECIKGSEAVPFQR
jgi:hypothetical protein